jgi:hypothetical protein
VTVILTFDLVLDVKFLWGEMPIALKSEIGRQKNQIHTSLSRDLATPFRLVGSQKFKVEGSTFLAFFVSDNRQPLAEEQPLHVTHIEKV